MLRLLLRVAVVVGVVIGVLAGGAALILLWDGYTTAMPPTDKEAQLSRMIGWRLAALAGLAAAGALLFHWCARRL